jgi:hypothetical protein
LSLEPALEIEIEDNKQEEDSGEADGDVVIVNFRLADTHVHYTQDVRTSFRKCSDKQIGLAIGIWHLLDTVSTSAL